MGENLVWALSLLVVAAVVVPYALLFRRQRHSDRARKEEAARLGVDKPTAQFPFVDTLLCIGCGACVDACPEAGVLGVVGGTAVVVNGLKCVGHGRCEVACPVGAIEVGLGDLKSRRDIPLMDAWQQTTVPGLYVAGEVAGLALVKNAVNQAVKVVDRIAQLAATTRKASDAGVVDVVIIGAGPAGLCAAAAAKEKGLTHVVLEQEKDLGGTIFHYPRRKLVLVQSLDIPGWGRLKEAEYDKERLLEILQELHRKSRLEVRFGEKVVGLENEDGVFSVASTSGVSRGRFAILALGRRGSPRKLGAPGEDLPKVMYQLVDAEAYAGQRILVVGGGDSAVEAALGLARQRGNRVTLSYRREKLVRIKQKNEDRIQALFAKRTVEPMFSSEVVEILPGSVRLKTGAVTRDLPNDFVFVFAGGEPPFAFLKQMGVRFGGEASAPANLTAGGAEAGTRTRDGRPSPRPAPLPRETSNRRPA
ncbi:MAG TPA: NAD(P)-binding domain-containing protein [Vicinamibacteria bacterium]